jgi:hypothetical protein
MKMYRTQQTQVGAALQIRQYIINLFVNTKVVYAHIQIYCKIPQSKYIYKAQTSQSQLIRSIKSLKIVLSESLTHCQSNSTAIAISYFES